MERDLRGFRTRQGLDSLDCPYRRSARALAATRFSKWKTKRGVCRRFRSVSRRQRKFFVWKQDRLAAAIVATVARKDFDSPGFQRWLPSRMKNDRRWE